MPKIHPALTNPLYEIARKAMKANLPFKVISTLNTPYWDGTKHEHKDFVPGTYIYTPSYLKDYFKTMYVLLPEEPITSIEIWTKEA